MDPLDRLDKKKEIEIDCPGCGAKVLLLKVPGLFAWAADCPTCGVGWDLDCEGTASS